jgi:plasmid stabilization system protein ParE
MVAELITTLEAEQDISEAYAWYETRQIGLGEEFLNCLDACIESIRRSPEIYPVVYEDYRRTLVRRFPYAVFYEYEDGRDRIRHISHFS